MIFKKIRKGHINWQDFLCSIPARDYVFQKDAYEDQIDRTAEYIRNADCVIIGVGAGASTAAGIQYGGKRFTDNFAEFIKKYGEHYMTDMYAAGFYPYPSEEAKWGYWSKHALMNRFDPPALPLYTELYDIVKNKEYLQHREIMEKSSARKPVIQRHMMRKNCFIKWMKQEKTA